MGGASVTHPPTHSTHAHLHSGLKVVTILCFQFLSLRHVDTTISLSDVLLIPSGHYSTLLFAAVVVTVDNMSAIQYDNSDIPSVQSEGVHDANYGWVGVVTLAPPTACVTMGGCVTLAPPTGMCHYG